MAAENTPIQPHSPASVRGAAARPASALLLTTLLLGTGALAQAQTAPQPGESAPSADAAHAPIPAASAADAPAANTPASQDSAPNTQAGNGGAATNHRPTGNDNDTGATSGNGAGSGNTGSAPATGDAQPAQGAAAPAFSAPAVQAPPQGSAPSPVPAAPVAQPSVRQHGDTPPAAQPGAPAAAGSAPATPAARPPLSAPLQDDTRPATQPGSPAAAESDPARADQSPAGETPPVPSSAQPSAQPASPAPIAPAPGTGGQPAPTSASTSQAAPSAPGNATPRPATAPAGQSAPAAGGPPAPLPAQPPATSGQTPPPSRPAPLPPTGTQPVPSGSASTRLPAAPDTTDYKKQARNCVVPESLLSSPTRLPGLTASLVRGKGDLLVLVLGSESTNPNTPLKGGLAALRKSAQPRQTPFAGRLEARLTYDLPPMPNRAIKVESIGRRNATVGEQAALIGKQVLPRKPALVIWNIGRADARRGMPPARMARALDKGLEQLRKQNIDTIVLDPPYHPQFEALYRTDDYRQYLRWTMNLHDQPMMRRYDMIDYWASTGRIDLDSGDAGRQETAVVFTETCIAYQLSRMIDKSLDRGASPAARQRKPG